MTSRRDFLGISTLSGGLLLRSTESRDLSHGSFPKFSFDRARFEAILSKPATHRQCIGSTQFDGLPVLHAMLATQKAYIEDLGESSGTIHTVAVLYGSAIGLVYGDKYWGRYIMLGKGNPYLHSRGADGAKQENSVENLVALGSTFFVCKNAVRQDARITASRHNLPSSDIYREIVTNLVPGALLVPSGFMALNACQEARFTYAPA